MQSICYSIKCVSHVEPPHTHARQTDPYNHHKNRFIQDSEQHPPGGAASPSPHATPPMACARCCPACPSSPPRSCVVDEVVPSAWPCNHYYPALLLRCFYCGHCYPLRMSLTSITPFLRLLLLLLHRSCAVAAHAAAANRSSRMIFVSFW